MGQKSMLRVPRKGEIASAGGGRGMVQRRLGVGVTPELALEGQDLYTRDQLWLLPILLSGSSISPETARLGVQY